MEVEVDTVVDVRMHAENSEVFLELFNRKTNHTNE